MKIVGATGLGGLWALEWAWHIRVRNLNLRSHLSIFYCVYAIPIS